MVPVSNSGEVGYCLTASAQQSLDAETETETLLAVAHALRGEGFDASEDGTGRATPLVPVEQPIPIDMRQASRGATMTNNRKGGTSGGAPGTGIGDPGDPAPSLSTSHVPAVAFDSKDSQCIVSKGNETLYTDGVRQGYGYASTSKANAGAILSGVRKALGEEAFAQWGLGILDTLQSTEILRSALHGCELRPAAFSRSWVVNCALSRPQNRGAGAVQSLREARSAGCSSQGWEPSEQRSLELGAYLSGLSQPGPQAERFMFDLWEASEGLGVLRQTLSALQEARRPARGEDQSAHGTWAVRRLTAEECEFLQGMPRGFTRIPYRGKPADRCPDGPRYKALGNSMAVNVMRWIGTRIQMVEDFAAREAA